LLFLLFLQEIISDGRFFSAGILAAPAESRAKKQRHDGAH
jgi:hypothetical protein